MYQGILQPDMWGVTPSDRWDWDGLRGMVANIGVRNSLLIAPMPTASTSQILGNNECFEPYTSNIYSRRVLRFCFPSLGWSLDPIHVLLLSTLLLFLQRWVCCGEQASSPWLDWDGSLVPHIEEQDHIWRWFSSEDSRNSSGTETHIQVRDSLFPWMAFWVSSCSQLC